jgi:REP element-mobilizing transposase RayT
MVESEKKGKKGKGVEGMPRKPREKGETGIYHVIVRGVGQQDIFHEEDDFHRYLETTKKISLESGVSILGYCLMTNHVHLLLRENNGDISVFMKRLDVSYAYWYNWKYERIGHVFQDRFKSECVEDDFFRNDIRIGISRRLKEFPELTNGRHTHVLSIWAFSIPEYCPPLNNFF